MTKSSFVCQQCGYSQVGWAGRCPNCGTWGSLIETVVPKSKISRGGKKRISKTSKPISLASIPSKKTSRILTKISELDRVLGGGLVAGQVVLLAGEPGIGKSTLLLEVASMLGDTLYVAAEESVVQIKLRADRLGIKKKSIRILEETNVDEVIDQVLNFKEQGLKLIVIDSIQAMNTSDLSGMAGSVGQVRECSYRLVRMAKADNIPLFLVGHVTKEGTVAGPAVLSHIVDSVLWFEGDKNLTFRLLRAVKNRFGPTDEVGIFNMEAKGLIPIEDTKNLFLSKKKRMLSGSVVTSVMEGTRPLLVEIQSLVVPTKMAFPRRVVRGLDPKRVELILAVLQRRIGLAFQDYDVFVNAVGGIVIKEPAVDLAVALSVVSSLFDKPLANNLLAIGEIGLLGEIREVIAEEKRLKEAKRLGFRTFVTQKEVKYLNQAIKKYLK